MSSYSSTIVTNCNKISLSTNNFIFNKERPRQKLLQKSKIIINKLLNITIRNTKWTIRINKRRNNNKKELYFITFNNLLFIAIITPSHKYRIMRKKCFVFIDLSTHFHFSYTHTLFAFFPLLLSLTYSHSHAPPFNNVYYSLMKWNLFVGY